MKVKDLEEFLSKCPRDCEVMIHTTQGYRALKYDDVSLELILDKGKQEHQFVAINNWEL